MTITQLALLMATAAETTIFTMTGEYRGVVVGIARESGGPMKGANVTLALTNGQTKTVYVRF